MANTLKARTSPCCDIRLGSLVQNRIVGRWNSRNLSFSRLTTILNLSLAILGTIWGNQVVHGEDKLDPKNRYAENATSLPMYSAVSTVYDSDQPVCDDHNLGRVSECDGIEAACGCPKCTERRNRIPLQSYWDNGLRFISADDRFNLHAGGNLQWDTVWLNGSDTVRGAPRSNATSTTNSGASLPRRARI